MPWIEYEIETDDECSVRYSVNFSYKAAFGGTLHDLDSPEPAEIEVLSITCEKIIAGNNSYTPNQKEAQYWVTYLNDEILGELYEYIYDYYSPEMDL